MRKNLFIALAKHSCLAFLFFMAIPLLLHAQAGTAGDGFAVQIIFPDGTQPVYALGAGGYGSAAFGAEITSEQEFDIAWARTAAGDSICCAPATNALAGKAALVRRGTCNFQLKCSNAEAGGAAAVIMVNNSAPTSSNAFAVTNMVGTGGAPNVGIPCIFVCRAVGNRIAAALDAGQPVRIRYVFPHLSRGVSAYHYATPVSQVSTLGAIGVTYYNWGADYEDLIAKADIIEPDGHIVSLLAPAAGIQHGQSTFIQFPPYTPPAIKGRFDVVFSTNKYHEVYDTVRSSFIQTENTWATDNYQLVPEGIGPNDADFVSAGLLVQTGSLCITGDQGAAAAYLSFGIANPAEVGVPGDPSASTILGFVFDADADADGVIDNFSNFSELSLLGLGTYAIEGTETPNALVHMQIVDLFTNGSPLYLASNHPYYVSLYYDGSGLGTGKSVRFTASQRVEYVNFPTTPVQLNQVFAGGFADATIVQRLQLDGFSPLDDPQIEPPMAGFQAAANNLQVAFTNTSANADAYAWDFGDGSTSALEHPMHDYAAPGLYTVKLVATNAAGDHAAVQTLALGNVAPVSAEFTASAPSGCAPFTVTFSEAVPQGPGLSYVWSFPGGEPFYSDQPNPTVTYTNAGTYPVSLLVSNGASSALATQAAAVTVNAVPIAIFTAPDTVGATIAFENISYYATGYLWDFGDGSASTEVQPVHTFPAGGEYTVTLIATSPCGADTGALIVTVHVPPVAGFSADQTSGCAPMTVHFNNQSSADATQFAWVFPGGTPASSTEENPVVEYSTPGSYDVSLTASSPGGSAVATQAGLISVGAAPNAGFTFSDFGGDVQFTNTSSGATGYLWDFGDGSTSTEANPVHQYTSGGTFTVTLTASNACGNQTYSVQVSGALPPVAAFTADSSSGCVPFTVHFTNHSTGNVTKFQWIFPGGSPATSTEANPAVTYHDPGDFDVMLIVSGPAGTDTLFQPGFITTNPLPIPAFDAGSIDGPVVYFFNHSQYADTYLWDFGDGSTSSESEPQHEYAGNGLYTIKLTAFNACGQTSITQSFLLEVGTHTPPLSENKFRVLPNPASSVLRVELALDAVNARTTVALFDVAGRLVNLQRQENIRQATFLLPVDLLPAGAYLLRIQTAEGAAVQQVQVLH